MADQSRHERRAFPRHIPAHAEAWLACESEGGERVSRAQLQDISVGGAALVVEGPLPETSAVWVMLDGVESAEWAKASVVRAGDGDGGLVHLQFADECPFALFQAAILGVPVPRGPRARVAAPSPPSVQEPSLVR